MDFRWWLISLCSQNLLNMTSLKFRVVLCRIRPFPTLISKIKWLWCELPLIWWKSLDVRDFQHVLSLVSEWKPSWLVDVNPIDVKYLRTGLSSRNSSISTFVFKNKYSKNKKSSTRFNTGHGFYEIIENYM